jgi:MYXO-CTERM domain-containing protein
MRRVALFLVVGMSLVVPAAARAANPGDVVISEVMWAGSNANSADEWVELYNKTAAAIDLSGWKLMESSGGTGVALSGTIASKGFHLVVGRSGDAVQNVPVTVTQTNITGFSSNLSNSGEQLTLKDGSDATIDTAGLPATAWFAGKANSNPTPDVSMERLQTAADVFGDGTVAGSWADFSGTPSTVLDSGSLPIHGTPGAANSSWGGGSSGIVIVIGAVTLDTWMAPVSTGSITVTVVVGATEDGTPRTVEYVNLKHREDGAGAWQSSAMTTLDAVNYTYTWEAPATAGIHEFYVEAMAGTTTQPVAAPATPDYVGFYTAGGPCIAPVRTVDANGAVTNLNKRVMVGGIVTTYNPALVQRTNDFFMQDSCTPPAGMNVDNNAGASFNVVPGDQVRVLGSLTQFNGLTRVEPKVVDKVAAGQPYVIPVMTLAQLVPNAEANESRVVRVNQVTVTSGDWPTAGNAANLTITDDNGSTTMVLRIDNDTNVDEQVQPGPTSPFDVQGLVNQYDTTSVSGVRTYLTGYQLTPRFAEDINPASSSSSSSSGGVVSSSSSAAGVSSSLGTSSSAGGVVSSSGTVVVSSSAGVSSSSTVVQSSSAVVVQSSSAVVVQSSSEVVVQSSSAVVAQSSSEVVVQSSSAVVVQSSSEVVVQSSSEVVVQSSSEVVVQSSSEVVAQSSSAARSSSTSSRPLGSSGDVFEDEDDTTQCGCNESQDVGGVPALAALMVLVGLTLRRRRR